MRIVLIMYSLMLICYAYPKKALKERQRCQNARSYAPYSYIFQAPSPVP